MNNVVLQMVLNVIMVQIQMIQMNQIQVIVIECVIELIANTIGKDKEVIVKHVMINVMQKEDKLNIIII